MEDWATLPVQCQYGMVTVNVERRRYDVEKMSEPRETAVRRDFFWYLMWRERGLFLWRLCRSTVTRRRLQHTTYIAYGDAQLLYM